MKAAGRGNIIFIGATDSPDHAGQTGRLLLES
jgi:hypothetical protein